MKKDKIQLEEAKKLLVEFRDVWFQAMKQVRMDKAKQQGSNLDSNSICK